MPFDNILDTDAVMMVNEDQHQMGVMSAEFLLKQLGDVRTGKVLEVRGVPGNSVDRDRHVGFHEVMAKEAPNLEIVEIVGNWDDGTSQKAAADALAVHGKFVAAFTQGGSTGSGARLHGCRPSDGADGGRGRERLSQVHRRIQGQGPEGPVLRPVARSGGDLDEGGDSRPSKATRCRN